MNEYVQPIMTIVGALIASYLGVRIALAELKGSVNAIKEDIRDNIKPEIARHRDKIHDQQNALLRLEGRVTVLEDRDE